MKIEFHDIIAVILLGGAIAMRLMGIDHLVDYIIIAIIAFYFGLKINPPNKNGNQTPSS